MKSTLKNETFAANQNPYLKTKPLSKSVNYTHKRNSSLKTILKSKKRNIFLKMKFISRNKTYNQKIELLRT